MIEETLELLKACTKEKSQKLIFTKFHNNVQNNKHISTIRIIAWVLGGPPEFLQMEFFLLKDPTAATRCGENGFFASSSLHAVEV